MKPIIEIRGVGKKYDIAHERGKYVALRDVLTGIAKRPFAFLAHKTKQVTGFAAKEEFWALRDINLTINKGEIVGIIGANGAGKSTLLKILTGITPPTEGEIIMRGRVASLLEVGTGFHPELTGRENIFLNGAILGMKGKEIADKFDEIVAFAGIEKFLDTPVKHYSSGMYVRLAFSVAAHMEPDILLVDEVLAVGDAEFQKKCMGKIEEVTSKDGRTILFVSHNLSAIQRLCKTSVVLTKGIVGFVGDTKEAINFYTEHQTNQPLVDLKQNSNRRGTGILRLVSFHIEDGEGTKVHAIESGADVYFVFSYSALNPGDIQSADFGFSLAKDDHLVCNVYSSQTKEQLSNVHFEGSIRYRIKRLPLAPNVYHVGARVLANGVEADWPKGSIGSFEVLPSQEATRSGYQTDPMSVIVFDGSWSPDDLEKTDHEK